MRGALRFFLAHLDDLKPGQWDWKAAPACRSIRETLRHLCETYPDKAALEEALARPLPDVSEVQALFEAAALADYARLRARYADTPLNDRSRRPRRRLVPGPRRPSRPAPCSRAAPGRSATTPAKSSISVWRPTPSGTPTRCATAPPPSSEAQQPLGVPMGDLLPVPRR